MAFRENGPLSPGVKWKFPNTPPLRPLILGTWKILEKFPAGSLSHDPMKEYVGNMKKYVKNMKKYVKNMKEYVGNMKEFEQICLFIECDIPILL